MQFNQVAFRYRRRAPWVLHDVTLTVPRGRIIEVNGRNGAGKSTLLRLIAGVVPPGRGRVAGRPSSTGYAPERFPAEQPFTARAYLGHMAAVRGAPPSRVGEWAERLGFTELLDTRLPDLSKGSAHKAGLVQALLAAPGLLVFDEPFAGLDARTRTALPALLAELASEGSSVIVSDHQGDLRELPGVMRWQVAGRTVTEGDLPEEHAVVEVVVPRSEAEDLVTRLKADGYEARCR
ncbi:ATP-binding cassette domain-containing protein [Actinoallomurus purpureus]|uniref:ATP-binding cassette domain-containing protein n=1 Tax=Actinoallomurus purpureus TaxID=478114 RepID=UPI002092243C|nr:ATP-binding cassette domain-containing protein [Actinoallomurus purpureus]MCO6011093.1 ATP-binding cassette domain-containing protein [Actinoallomurus purpureus]